MQTKAHKVDLEYLNKGRAAIYEFLSVLFIDSPDKNFLGLSQTFAPIFAELALARGSLSLAMGADLLAKYADYEKYSDMEKVLDELNIQYTGLFLLGFTSIGLTESINCTPERINKQEPWEKVIAFYHIRKFKIPPAFKEPEDHIAMELLFMRQMSELAGRCIKEGEQNRSDIVLAEQLRFLEDHLLAWAPAVCIELERKAADKGYTLYHAAALLLQGFLSMDKETVRYILE